MNPYNPHDLKPFEEAKPHYVLVEAEEVPILEGMNRAQRRAWLREQKRQGRKLKTKAEELSE